MAAKSVCGSSECSMQRLVAKLALLDMERSHPVIFGAGDARRHGWRRRTTASLEAGHRRHELYGGGDPDNNSGPDWERRTAD